MRTKIRLKYVLPALAVVFFSCKETDSPSTQSETYLKANIDNTLVNFQNSRVRQINNGPYQLVGEIQVNDQLERVLSFTFSGLPGNSENTVILTGTYYEDDYAESWTNFGPSGGLDFVNLSGNDDYLSGEITDFIAVNGLDTIDISAIEFNGVPIR